MAGVFLAVGAVHAINGMIFAVPAPAEVSTAHETKGDQLALSASDEGQVGPSPVLARLAADARATLAVPDDLIVFAEPGAFVGRFGNAVNAPGEGAFASAGNVPRTDGNFPPPPRTAEPAEPTLLAYVPLPQLVSDAAAETVSRPLARAVEITERATGAPLDLTAALGLDISGGAAGAGSRSMVTMSASTGASSTTVVRAAAEAAVDTSTRVAASASSTLGGAVKSVAGLLR
jgi:hypothetical protein